MIPSLVARELKKSIVEYLATTFALSEDEAYEALTEFLLDEDDGIFRGSVPPGPAPVRRSARRR